MTTIKKIKLIILATVVITFTHTTTASSPSSAWSILKQSNKEFVNDEKKAKKRKKLKAGQNPPYIILSCSDSRVPPEIIFKQKLGDFFVVRTAGHVVDDVAIQSIEYAVKNFDSSLLIIVGHSDCGAVGGALKHLQKNNGVADLLHSEFGAVLAPIENAIIKDNIAINGPNALAKSIKANVEHTAQQLMKRSKIIRDAVNTTKLALVGAKYFLEDGKVVQLFITGHEKSKTK
jgi:carbonic anhydrase